MVRLFKMSSLQDASNDTGNNDTDGTVAVIVEGTLSGIGILTCAISITLVVVLKLYKQLIYRLALYQASTALAIGIVYMLDVIQFIIIKCTNEIYLPLCLLDAFAGILAPLAKLFFTVFLSFHIFFFAVCYRNFKRLEACYVVTSLVIPGVMAAVPFIHNVYGQQQAGLPWCWIVQENGTNVWFVEASVLWSAPAAVGLIIIVSLFAIMLTVLARRVCGNSIGARMNKTAIKQMLPLMAYPITYCVLLSNIYVYYLRPKRSKYNALVFVIIDQVVNTGMVWIPGVTLLVHILVMVRSTRKSPATTKISTFVQSYGSDGKSIRVTRSSTYVSLPNET